MLVVRPTVCLKLQLELGFNVYDCGLGFNVYDCGLGFWAWG